MASVPKSGGREVIPTDYAQQTAILKAALADRAEEVAMSLYPGGKRDGKNWCVGDITGAPGQSFKVCIAGPMAGVCTDFADGAQAKPPSLIDCYAAARGVDFKTACRDLEKLVGVDFAGMKVETLKIQTRPKAVVPERVPAMPEAVANTWREGVVYARSKNGAVHLAKFRGWPGEACQDLLDAGQVAVVEYYGKRCWAFLVTAPEAFAGGVIQRPVGVHLRVPAVEDGGRPSWRFMPSGVPSLPFTVGTIQGAETLIVCEGQWDALTFMIAAGWTRDFPQRTCILGIRGNHGGRVFIEHYRQFLRPGMKCLLVCDNDSAGRTWTNGEHSLAVQLGELGLIVKAVKTSGHKDLNDAYRAGDLGADDVLALLAGVKAEERRAA